VGIMVILNGWLYLDSPVTDDVGWVTLDWFECVDPGAHQRSLSSVVLIDWG
jgi:hypothetical protein